MTPYQSKATLPVAPYVGGKRKLAAAIIERIELIPHTLYCEPFVGMGGVFLRRRQPAEVEVINDFDTDVTTFFRVLQSHYTAFLDMMRYQLTSRAEFERLTATAPETLTDLERSARFLYLQRAAFGGKVRGQTFGTSRTTPARFDLTKLVPMLEDVHERLSRVVIERLPYGEAIERYDRPGALFYCDPPYFGTEDYYRPPFGVEDFSRLADILERIKGRFILTINDAPEMRDVFGRFQITPVELTYTLAGASKRKRVGELIIEGGGR